MSQKLINIKEWLISEKKNIVIVVILLFAVGVACWGMFSGGILDDGRAIDNAKREIEQARIELDIANRKLAESQAIVSELRRTNSDITAEINALTRENYEIRAIADTLRQTNRDIASQLTRGSTINNENLQLTRECKQELSRVRKASETRD